MYKKWEIRTLEANRSWIKKSDKRKFFDTHVHSAKEGKKDFFFLYHKHRDRKCYVFTRYQRGFTHTVHERFNLKQREERGKMLWKKKEFAFSFLTLLPPRNFWNFLSVQRAWYWNRTRWKCIGTRVKEDGNEGEIKKNMKWKENFFDIVLCAWWMKLFLLSHMHKLLCSSTKQLHIQESNADDSRLIFVDCPLGLSYVSRKHSVTVVPTCTSQFGI